MNFIKKNKIINLLDNTISYQVTHSSFMAKITFILLIYFLAFDNHLHSQDTLNYQLDKNNTEVGITVGGFLPLFINLEVSLSINNRVSKSIVLEAKPLVGQITQLLLFEGNQERYKIVYGGGSIGLNVGKKNKFFELTLGSAYFHRLSKAVSSTLDRFLPIGTIGYKHKGEKMGFRVGMGFPHGIYISFNF